MKIETKFDLRETATIPAIGAPCVVVEIAVTYDGTFYQVEYCWAGKLESAWLHESAIEK